MSVRSAESATGPAWVELGRANGVVLRSAGEGPPVVLFPGLEGSGESCLHLAEPVVLGNPGPASGQLLLVDYAGERHRFLGELVDTISGLLVEHLNVADRVTWWGQSFGNLLMTRVEPLVPVRVRARVLVSPFTELPGLLVRSAASPLAVTPTLVYRLTTPPVARWLFGPMPGGTGDAFVAAVTRMAPSEVGRRVGWLADGDGAGAFLASTVPCGVWLGENDRLVDLSRQLAFFTALTRGGGRTTVVPGSGHVPCPAPAVRLVRDGVAEWIGSSE